MRSARVLQEITATMGGILTAHNYQLGAAALASKDYTTNECVSHISTAFEIARRYKIMNPDLMRGEYGKMVYLLQDTCCLPDVAEQLGASFVTPIVTVYDFLKKRGGLGVLTDPSIATATMEILSHGRDRASIQRDIREKERKREYIAMKYQTKQLSSDQIRWCLYSISDNHSYLHATCDPIDYLIHCLTTMFSADTPEDNLSLDITHGHEGARLTHGHAKQYRYVLQSLCLWREIVFDMFRLWILAEMDLLDANNPYTLMGM